MKLIKKQQEITRYNPSVTQGLTNTQYEERVKEIMSFILGE